MGPEERGEWDELLRNWGRWAGGPLDDPALVDYYTVSPMFRDAPYVRKHLKSSKAIDPDLAEIIEAGMLELRRSCALWFRQGFRSYYFRHLVLRYADNMTEQSMADLYGVSRDSMRSRLDVAIKRLAEIVKAQQKAYARRL
jgi:hypothetical protein